MDREHCIIEWNHKLQDLTGYDLDQVKGLAIESLCLENCHESLSNVWNEGFQRPSECTMVLQSSGGTLLCFTARTVPHSLDRTDGDSAEAVVFLLETNPQVLKGFSLSSSSSKKWEETASLARRVGLPMVAFDHTGCIRVWNRPAADCFGYDASEARGENIYEYKLLDSGRQHTFKEIVEKRCSCRVLRSSGLQQLEVHTKSGQTKTVLANLITLDDESVSSEPSFGTLVVTVETLESTVAVDNRTGAGMPLELGDLLNTLNAPIFGLDSHGKVNEWNEKMGEITGYGREEVIHSPFLETVIPQEKREKVRDMLQSVAAGVPLSNLDIMIQTKSDERRTLQVNVSPVRDSDGVGFVVLAQDVTEAFLQEKAVRAMARELRLLIDSANAPIFGIDCMGDVNEWNQKMAELTGYSQDEAMGRHLVTTFIDERVQDSAQHVLDKALTGKGTSHFEMEIRTISNNVRHFLVNVNTRRDADNVVVGAVLLAQDVTEAVHRDRAVAAMALELRQLIDTANAPIFGIDIDGNVNEWNKCSQGITGFSKEEAFDEPLVEKFIAPSMRQKVHEILDAALHGNETSNYELEFVSKSGEPRFLLVNATTRRDPEFNIVGVVGVAQDVTEHKKHAAELRKMQLLQAKQEASVETERNMTAYFAHELRNPLGAIDSALNAMPEELPEAAKSLVDGMQLCSRFMSSIMNNLLDVRKMEEGKMKLSNSPLSLTGLLRRVHTMLLPSVKTGVEFEYASFTEGNDWVMGDEHRIQQILTNVVTNAIKYTLKGLVRLSISWSKQAVKFECTDTGPGIPKSEQKKLFQRFVQRGGAPGTGLGLAISKHLVTLMSGEIAFISDPSVQPGTTCIVRIPLNLCEAPENANINGKIQDPRKTSMLPQLVRFLIIDDVEMNRKMLGRRIQRSIAPNCTIEEAINGEEALTICGDRKFDAIIVDQYMEEAGGVMVGTDVVFAMRRMRVDSIIIGCSGNDLNREFIEAGADWVWQKPLPTNETIISHLRALLKSLNDRRREE